MSTFRLKFAKLYNKLLDFALNVELEKLFQMRSYTCKEYRHLKCLVKIHVLDIFRSKLNVSIFQYPFNFLTLNRYFDIPNIWRFLNSRSDNYFIANANLKFNLYYQRHFHLRISHEFYMMQKIDEYKVPLTSPLKCHYMGIVQLLTYFKVCILFVFDWCHQPPLSCT